jgi:hypothetical protein
MSLLVSVLVLVVGLAAPAVGAVSVVGRTVQFAWTPSVTGDPIGYQVYITRNNQDERVFLSTVADSRRVLVSGEYGDLVRVRVLGFDTQLNIGPLSEYSAWVRFVETAPVDPPTDDDPDPDPQPDPDPDPDPQPDPDPTPGLSRAALDFDGDGRSDLVIRDHDTGETRVLLMDGATPVGTRQLASHSSRHVLVGNGDYNGDRIADALWLDVFRDDLLIELTDPAAPSDGEPLAASRLPWSDEDRLGGAGDFDGDGRTDIVVYDDDSRDLRVWIMDGVSIDRIQTLGSNRNYRQLAVGDFDGNGFPEILDDRPVYKKQRRREVADGTIAWTDDYSENIDSSWVPIGVAEFDGDGVNDVLWLDSDTGVMEAWCFGENGDLVRYEVDRTLPPGAEVSGSGDYDGDGRGDIAVREEFPGGLSVWLMDGTSVRKVVPVSSLSASWSLVGLGGEAPMP